MKLIPKILLAGACQAALVLTLSAQTSSPSSSTTPQSPSGATAPSSNPESGTQSDHKSPYGTQATPDSTSGAQSYSVVRHPRLCVVRSVTVFLGQQRDLAEQQQRQQQLEVEVRVLDQRRLNHEEVTYRKQKRRGL